MEILKQYTQAGGAWCTAALLTGAACVMGALFVMVRRANSHQKAKKKILSAQARREQNFQQAERAVLEYKKTHPMANSAFILKLSLSELTKQLQEGSLSPEDVFYTFMEKTLDVQKRLNCCTEVMLESFEQLKTISSSKKGVLYGVPFSVKENLLCKNHDSSCGLLKNLDKPAEDDCVLVKVLKNQGAIPFVRTNLPQALLSYDCSNPIYGQTLNPHNLQKTSGGSSGGEAALIGGGGSVIGIGTDIGGSIRIPSSFCGACGFKPTAGRLSLKGLKSIYRGQKAVLTTTGPMGKDVDSLALFMQAILCDDMFSLDPTVPPLSFNEQVYQSRKPLRIGYLENDCQAQPSPSMSRGVREVKALLEQAGHTLVPYKPVRILDVIALTMKGILADGGASFLKLLEGGPIDPIIRSQVTLYRLPTWFKKALTFILKPLMPRLSHSLQNLTGVGSIADHWKTHAAIEDCVNDTIAEWRRLNIDVLLCPMIGPAFNLGFCGQLSTLLSYSVAYNLLNFSAGVVPVSTVNAQDEKELYTLDTGDMYDRIFKQAVTGGEGLPVAVQCVALPWQDELCLRFMKEVEELVMKAGNKC